MSASSGGDNPPKITTPRNSTDSDMEMASPMGNIVTNNTNIKNSNTLIRRQTVSGQQIVNKINNSHEIINLSINNSLESGSSSTKTDSTERQKRSVFLYDKTDIGPYTVYIENNLPNFDGKLNPIKIGDILYTNHPELDNKINSIDSIGRNRVRIKFKDSFSANCLIKSANLQKYNLEAYVPKFMLHKQGIIKGVEIDYDEEYIKQKICQFDMHCKFSVETVKRMHVKENNTDGTKKLIPTRTVLVVFKSQVLPKYICINHVRIPVEPYQQKVLLCYNCFRYGHLGKQCRANVRCLKCRNNHKTEECVDNLNPKCFHCDGDHLTTEIKKCPEFKRQQAIKKFMSESNLSFSEASAKLPKMTYASVTEKCQSLPVFQSPKTITTLSSSVPSQSTSSYHTHLVQNTNNCNTKPQKRPRIAEENRTLDSHRNILRSPLLPSIPVTQNPIYQSNIHLPTQNQPNISLSASALLDLVVFIIDTLKQKNTFDIQELDLFSIIQNRFLNNNLNG